MLASNPNEELKPLDIWSIENIPYALAMSEKERGGEVEDKLDFTNDQEKFRNRLCLSRYPEIQRKVLEQEGERNKLYDWNWMENVGVYLQYVGEDKGFHR